MTLIFKRLRSRVGFWASCDGACYKAITKVSLIDGFRCNLHLLRKHPKRKNGGTLLRSGCKA
jgi:hypothetical protein